MSSESEMTKETSSGCSLLGIFHRYPRLMQGVSLIGGLGILSSGFVVAQTDSPIDTGIAPAKTAPERPIKTAPAPAPEPAARPRPTAPEPIAAPEASAYKPAREPAPYASTKPYVPTSESGSYSSKKPVGPISEPAPYAAKKPVAPVRARVESAPVANFVEKKPALASPNLSLPDSETVAQPPKVILKPAQIQENAKTPFEPANNFIDRTDYSIGATPRYEGPTSVVLSERSTGCQTVSQNGQLSSGVCGVAASSQQTANQPIANQPIGNQKVGNQPIANQPIGNQKVGNQPIGSQQTAISKLTLQEPLLTGVLRLPKPPVAAVQPSNPGFLKLADSGSRPTRQIPYSEYSAAPIPSRSSQSYYSAAPSTSSRGLDYYNLSTRPVGRPNIGKTSFMFPLAIPAAITSLFGWRVHPISGDYRFHAGTDLGAPEGTPVIAAVSGQVVNANFLGGYGLTVVLQHEKGTQQSLYGHLSEIFVQPGQQVEQGNVIGRVGSTGNSTGPHLHFEWRHLTSDGWVAVDAGAHLEYSLAQFIRALQIAQSSPQRGT